MNYQDDLYVNINEGDERVDRDESHYITYVSSNDVCCDMIICIIVILLYSCAITYFIYMIID